MRYHALACDFDGTTAWNGHVDDATVAALARVRDSGRRLLLVTGRELDDLSAHFSRLDLFDRVVTEDGAVVYDPATNEQTVLGEPPPTEFVDDLRALGVHPLSVGEVIVATWHPHEFLVLDTINKHALELQVIFNKGAVMVLPPGINKATGLTTALKQLQLSPRNTVCVGDAENDYAMFQVCEYAVAVDNALPSVKVHADLVTTGHHGHGVIELVGQLIASDLQAAPPPRRHSVLMGHRTDDEPVLLSPYGPHALLAGTAGSGKSRLAASLVQRLVDQGYQVCVLDPEGDYSTIEGVVHLGDSSQAPCVLDVSRIFQQLDYSVVVNLLGIPFQDRPSYFDALYPAIAPIQARTGRPHWLIVDEAHHLLPSWRDDSYSRPCDQPSLMLITVDPRHLPSTILEAVGFVVATGDRVDDLLRWYSDMVGATPPELPPMSLACGEGLGWYPGGTDSPFRFRIAPCRTIHRRHRRKYAEGDMGTQRSFYFRGPGDRLNIGARNLLAFIDIAEHVDDTTWDYHRQRGDYSAWIRGTLGDQELADELAAVEDRTDLSARESRRLIRNAIERCYTLPA